MSRRDPPPPFVNGLDAVSFSSAAHKSLPSDRKDNAKKKIKVTEVAVKDGFSSHASIICLAFVLL